jgi:hypothetical protein
MREPATKTDLRKAENGIVRNALLMIGSTVLLAAAIILV